MNILIDIGHPAHVHYYRNLTSELQKRNHKVVLSVKNIPVAKSLLDYYGFEYYTLPKKKDGLRDKILGQLKYNWQIWNICKKEKIDIALGTSVSIAHVSKVSSVKSVLLDDDDDEVQPFITKYVNPFTDNLLSPEALKGKRKRKDTIYYPGYHELAYLHPIRFKPDESIIKEVGLKKCESFFIMRFNSFLAHHDIGIKGLSLNQKLLLIDLLKPHGKIFITTERNIEPELQQYQLKISPEKIHSLMAFATMFLGDSQTMTSEAAVLGTPALKCNTFAGKLSVPNELENIYGLCYSFLPNEFDKMIMKIKSLLEKENLDEIWNKKRQVMLSDKIDVTAFLTWFIENYPQSVKIMKENPDYQYRFK